MTVQNSRMKDLDLNHAHFNIFKNIVWISVCVMDKDMREISVAYKLSTLTVKLAVLLHLKPGVL